MKRISVVLVTILMWQAACCAAARDWRVEAEKGGYVKWLGDSVADIHAPGGLTLWNTQKMQGNVVIEYDARIVSDERVSDLNCFWMASGGAKSGRFVDYYAQTMYYMGYGGNYNKTTRFRRYNGDARGIEQSEYRPAILREYTDEAHMIKPDHWYHIRLEQIDGRVKYIIDGECLVDFIDMHPLTEGYFGFRTTLAHAQLKGFSYRQLPATSCKEITLPEAYKKPQTFGIPFLQGELGAKENVKCSQPSEQWNLAYWPDGSVKWKAVTIVPEANDNENQNQNFWLEQDGRTLPIKKVTEEFQGKIRKVTKYEGDNFVVRRYSYKGSIEQKFVITHFIDSATNANGMQSLAMRFKVHVDGKLHEKKVAFMTDSTHREMMSIKPLFARRPIALDDDGNAKDPMSQFVLDNIAAWDGFRLSQLSPNGFSIRKRATDVSPWIGTIEGRRAPGVVALGNKERSYAFHLDDFWQSYPSTLQVDDARSDTATVSLYLWSPEAEKMDFAHYDTIAHTLEAAYEDVQPGMSTAYGIARTSVIYLYTYDEGIDSLGNHLAEVAEHPQYVMPREYLHSKRAFGIWSLDDGSAVDSLLYAIADYYAKEVDRNGWYGYFNYGDVMHAGMPGDNGDGTESVRWFYDVGGFAWDNTELGTPAMLWYEFLRTGCPEVWRMAVAMTRHNAEVDCYHMGPHKGLGTRHNVLHWGCGAKEARISEAFWNRFLYYLTADERMGDVMHEVVDADQLLYTLDPMRLAQPRSPETPCTAPARLRIGPDWLAYASNWFTEWERTQNTKYRDKIERGMESINSLPHGIFSGPKALGYDPATGIITWEGDTAMQNTNHLLPLMGGFEMMTEMMLSMPFTDKKESKTIAEKWQQTWLDMCCEYKEKALKISRNVFRIPRLQAYAYWFTGKEKYRDIVKKELRIRMPIRATNDAATYTLDAIFSKEVMGSISPIGPISPIK